MKNIPAKQLEKDLNKILENAATDNEFYCVDTTCGKVVIISEDEWNTLKGFAQIAMSNPSEFLDIIKNLKN